ncbi:MAG: FemAB family PEP-CTERM system-associated protein [Phycisphaeraceae bacterium]|nr:FemAB family PEP-CTERM system-associated protein [Phycisphaeraceae bacterium]
MVRAYLLRHPQACPELDPRWLTVLREALNHRIFMLIAWRDGGEGTMTGYLPLALVSSPLFGRFLVSLPYLNRAGVLADSPDIAAELIAEAAALAGRLDVRYLELRHEEPTHHETLSRQRDEKVRMVLELPGNGEALWQAIDSKVRNQIRKAEKSNLTVKWGGLDLLDGFYDVFATNMRDLGTPVYSRKLFEAILRHFPQEAELAVMEHENQAIAGALLVHDTLRSTGGCTQVPSASALKQFNHLNANMGMYHHLLLRTIERGGCWFDFGRSSVDSGTYRFKKQWGARPLATVWQYHVRRGDIDAVRPDNPRYQRRIRAWRKLPVWVTKWVGPVIVRGIP